ncbi:alpha-E domain-containing protein [Rhodobacteraceae bacterium N5(2021)]|uniref:Alpha-E domain-containing protein n=1 Tax=Gymnodinialimonas phycosphaerae TaxID=2841589 RepID=A0A975YHB6_9RHOB|nr:alpha-E domain-containing protein [Gymnodinialimonas phycosphaerae]MBY4892525.1 alpha-E domain-containing protein [Gymnodinialimonas phycosphaerae]
MLGKTAGGLYWLFRYLERSENTARLIETGFRIALTRPDGSDDEWRSVLQTAAVRGLYEGLYGEVEETKAIDFLLRDRANPSSILSSISEARQNARLTRTALTREVWEAINDAYMNIKELLANPVSTKQLPAALATIRQHSALVRGAMHGTMLRTDIFDFCRLGTFIERADNTARILDVKYYVLLPSMTQVGSDLDNVQWETILRAVASHRSYRWLMGGDVTPKGIADFLIFDTRMPRSLRFTVKKMASNLEYLSENYGARHPCHDQMDVLLARLKHGTIDDVFQDGLHEFLTDFLSDIGTLGAQIERDYRFLG